MKVPLPGAPGQGQPELGQSEGGRAGPRPLVTHHPEPTLQARPGPHANVGTPGKWVVVAWTLLASGQGEGPCPGLAGAEPSAPRGALQLWLHPGSIPCRERRASVSPSETLRSPATPMPQWPGAVAQHRLLRLQVPVSVAPLRPPLPGPPAPPRQHLEVARVSFLSPSLLM